MKEFIERIKNDRLIYRLLSGSVLLILISLVYILINFQSLPPLIPLFNQLPWGDRRIAESWLIFLPIFLMSLILIINLLLSLRIYEKAPLISRIFAVTAFTASLLTFLFIIKTIGLIL